MCRMLAGMSSLRMAAGVGRRVKLRAKLPQVGAQGIIELTPGRSFCAAFFTAAAWLRVKGSTRHTVALCCSRNLVNNFQQLPCRQAAESPAGFSRGVRRPASRPPAPPAARASRLRSSKGGLTGLAFMHP